MPWAATESNERLFIENPASDSPVRGSSFLVPMKSTDVSTLLEWHDRSAGITTDTRQCGPGMLFFALRGERFNGNEFARQAIQAGCLAAVVDDPELEGEGLLLVPDVLEALQHYSFRYSWRPLVRKLQTSETHARNLCVAHRAQNESDWTAKEKPVPRTDY